MTRLEPKQPIFICGMMGAGKSTIGKILADKLNLPFKDLDEMIVKQEEMPIPKIFSQKGEPYFREVEKKLLIKSSQTFNGIMALGGGSLQDQRIIDHLKIFGWTVFLEVSQSVLLNRLIKGTNRPLLNTGQSNDVAALEKKIQTLLDERNPFYRQAHITINCDGLRRGEIVSRIVDKIALYEGKY